MPGFALAPADKVTAKYDVCGTGCLTLHATGTVNCFMKDFSFERDPMIGGLKISFQCWYDYAVMGTKPLDHVQTFIIPNLKAFDPEMTVTIVDSNNPKGQVIPIEIICSYGAEVHTNDINASKPSSSSPTNSPLPIIVPLKPIPKVIERTVFYKEPFTISTSTGSLRTISEKHDKDSLLLMTADYDNDNLSWTYNSLQTSITEVILTADSEFLVHDLPVVTTTIYIIRIILPTSIAGLLPPPNEILTFKGRVSLAQKIVKEQYPDASLITVDVKSPSPYPVTDPLRLSHMRCLFHTEKGQVSITSAGWGTFEPPSLEGENPLGIKSFNIQDYVDITDAVKDMQKVGISEAFFRAELYEVLAEKPDQPFYLFHMVNGSYTYVGAKDGSVRNVPVALKTLLAKA